MRVTMIIIMLLKVLVRQWGSDDEGIDDGNDDNNDNGSNDDNDDENTDDDDTDIENEFFRR